jgi:NAD(P)H-nitrite reductase large subunit
VQTKYDIVIIGNSAAGISAIKKIRTYSKDVSVALIDRENRPAYSRVMTPYFVGNKIPKEGLYIVDNDYYDNLGIKTFFGLIAEEIDSDKKMIRLSNGDNLEFDKLLIATGAEATKINVESKYSSCLRHMSDAEKLYDSFKSAKSVTAIGAGLVSVPVLSHLKDDVEKNLIIGSKRIFSRVVNKEAAEIIENSFIQKGVNIYKSDDIESFTENDRLNLKLKSGKNIDTDMLVVGKGVTPNVDIAKNAGLDVNDGIVINEFSQTSMEDIYAAGDVAEGIDFITGEKLIQGNWMTAVEQGEIAALNMLGFKTDYEGSLKNNITEVFGVEVAVVGYYYDDAPNSETYYNELTGIYRKVFLDENNVVIGATLVGDTNDSGLYYHMVKTREKFGNTSILSKFNNYARIINEL